MTNTFSYFPGCLVRGRLPQMEVADRLVFSLLDLNLSQALDYSCCPEPINLRGAQPQLWLQVALRNLGVAEENGQNKIVTPCPGCYQSLSQACQIAVDNSSEMQSANNTLQDLLNMKYRATVDVKHFTHVLNEEVGPALLRKKRKKSLNGLKVAVHYGCHLLRPQKLAHESAENPRSIDNIIEAIGGTAIEYETKKVCCGMATGGIKKEVGHQMALDKITRARAAGAECMIVACPSCLLQLQLVQRKEAKENQLPVIYLSDLIALSLGADSKQLGLDMYYIDINTLIETFIA